MAEGDTVRCGVLGGMLAGRGEIYSLDKNGEVCQGFESRAVRNSSPFQNDGKMFMRLAEDGVRRKEKDSA